MTKKSINMPVFRVECDDFTIDGLDGEELAPRDGEWIDIKRRMPAKLVRMLVSVNNMRMEDEESALNSLGNALDELVPLLAQVLVDWNWTDIWDTERPPLGKPTEETLWRLDIEELFYLSSKLMGQSEPPKAPKSQ
jgi:hypothetical protein